MIITKEGKKIRVAKRETKVARIIGDVMNVFIFSSLSKINVCYLCIFGKKILKSKKRYKVKSNSSSHACAPDS